LYNNLKFKFEKLILKRGILKALSNIILYDGRNFCEQN